jgi:hypothetical protein
MGFILYVDLSTQLSMTFSEPNSDAAHKPIPIKLQLLSMNAKIATQAGVRVTTNNRPLPANKNSTASASKALLLQLHDTVILRTIFTHFCSDLKRVKTMDH